jgi:hypothetical protein
MLEVIVLIFLTRRMGNLAIRKGLKPISWKLYTVLAWIVAELTGCLFAMFLFGNTNYVAIFSIGLLSAFFSIAYLSAFGGYLIIRAILEKRPDYIDEDIDRIGVDDLKPPVK